MASFMANLFPSSRDAKNENIQPLQPPQPPQMLTRTSQNEPFIDPPSTPSRNNFITPVQTPQGSPSKSRNPPGANDLPIAFDNAMKLTHSNFGSPTKNSRQNAVGTPLSPGKSNTMAIDDSYFGGASINADDSIIHKSAVPLGSPLRKQGKENTPPSTRPAADMDASQNQAAVSRQEIYQSREQSSPSFPKYNTQRGLTAEELEILQKPNVRRLANVTQLCMYPLNLSHFMLT
jgi:cell cycle protein kinase DBF2